MVVGYWFNIDIFVGFVPLYFFNNSYGNIQSLPVSIIFIILITFVFSAGGGVYYSIRKMFSYLTYESLYL